MKTVYLVRHSQAENQKEGLSDFNRSLTKEGIKNSNKAAKAIKKKVTGNILLISSPANRALETSHIFAEKLDYPISKVLLKEEILTASAEQMLALLKETEDNYDTVVLFGHNPSISEVASLFIQELKFELPTSGILVFEFNNDSWKDIETAKGILIHFEFSKQKTKYFQKVFSLKISQTVSELLNKINPKSSTDISKYIEKHSDKLARNFLKNLYWKPYEKSVDK